MNDMPTLTEQIVATPEGMRAWQQERLILEITERICELMQKAPMSRTELADRLGKSAGHVTQLLSGSANMTVRTVSDLFFALGRAAVVTDRPLAETAHTISFSFDCTWNPPAQNWPRFKVEVPTAIGTG